VCSHFSTESSPWSPFVRKATRRIQKICGHATDEISELYSTVPQREIQAAVGAVISLAKYRELLQDGASWWESGGKGPQTANGHPAVAR
jgi:hypothetical protein